MTIARGEPADLPLARVRVVDLTEDLGAMCGRFLADLGADVILVEAPDNPARKLRPAVNDVSLAFQTRHANKRSVVIDWSTAAGREELFGLTEDADILVESQGPGRLDEAGIGVAELHRRNPRLVVTSISDFGQTGPYRDWLGTDWVQLALSSGLARSGNKGEPPLMPPGRLPSEHASMQAVWATLVAYWNALRSGLGDHVDLSVLEATVQSFDPAFGIAGSATSGVPASALPPGRPDARHQYPILRCADGHVRICVLAKRQWLGMFAWLGEPAEFADPKYEMTRTRFAAADRLHALIGELFATRTRAELLGQGQRHGVPIESLNLPADVLHSEHLAFRGAWRDLALGDGLTARVPDGLVEIDGLRAGIRTPAPAAGSGTPGWLGPAADRGAVPAGPGSAPLSGVRVLDLGVIVVGAETGRLFADLGADVIKVESSAFPDGSRAASRPGTVSATFAYGHRNKRSLGLDLRSPEGKDLFIQLAAVSDVILSNFKPGTLESLGLGYEVLAEANPAIVMVDSSAFGPTGPESRRMGYGPLVRAGSGLTSLWRYPDQVDGFCDSSTVYPDHIAARVGAATALALLIRRQRTRAGGVVSVAQAEVMLTQFADEFGLESVQPGSLGAVGNTGRDDAPWGVYPCAGEDQWCVVTVCSDEQWLELCAAIGEQALADDLGLRTATGRLADRERIESHLIAWTTAHEPREAMNLLQQHAVPAAAMLRVNDLLHDPHLAAREFFTTMNQPSIGDLPTERGPAHFARISDPALGPAPLQGQHTREIVRELIGLTESDIDKLIEQGVLEQA
jgi:crotonobetainyl-CoA:carnitine CoA-transferase CaiB-like acyl-CoA transferase